MITESYWFFSENLLGSQIVNLVDGLFGLTHYLLLGWVALNKLDLLVLFWLNPCWAHSRPFSTWTSCDEAHSSNVIILRLLVYTLVQHSTRTLLCEACNVMAMGLEIYRLPTMSTGILACLFQWPLGWERSAWAVTQVSIPSCIVKHYIFPLPLRWFQAIKHPNLQNHKVKISSGNSCPLL